MANPTNIATTKIVEPEIDRDWLNDKRVYQMIKENDMPAEYYQTYQEIRKPHSPAGAIEILKDMLVRKIT